MSAKTSGFKSRVPHQELRRAEENGDRYARPEMLTSLQNPLVKQMRKLRQAKERRAADLCLLEGTHLLDSACAASYPLATVCCTPQWQQSHPALWQRAFEQATRTEVVTPEIIGAIATTIHPDGVVATAPRLRRSPPTQVNLGLMLERLQDPGNLGTIIRTSVAVGVDGLWLSEDSVDLDHPKVMRASAGEWFRLPTAVANLPSVIERYQQVQLVATLPQAEITYWELDWTKPTLILLGNEGAGLSESLVALADRQVKIPLSAGVESLNVAIAAALMLFEAQRQRLAKRYQ